MGGNASGEPGTAILMPMSDELTVFAAVSWFQILKHCPLLPHERVELSGERTPFSNSFGRVRLQPPVVCQIVGTV